MNLWDKMKKTDGLSSEPQREEVEIREIPQTRPSRLIDGVTDMTPGKMIIEKPKEVKVFKILPPTEVGGDPIVKILKGWATIELALKEYEKPIPKSELETRKKED